VRCGLVARGLVASGLIASGLALLSACTAPEVPKEQYFRLIAAPAEVHATKPLDGVVEIAPFGADGVMAERPLLFTANGGRKLEQRNYAYWTNPPPQMLRDQLVAYLRAAQFAPQVVPSEMRIDAKYAVRGTVRRLEQTANPNGAVIEIELSLIEEASNRLIASKLFHAEQPSSSSDIDDAVKALNAGMNQIFHDFVVMASQAAAGQG
jgi:cholesterol transport system auxiliary component